MGYRLPDKRRHLKDVASESTISVDNGTISNISIPCHYLYGEEFPHHDRIMHDHLGWPSPDNPDWSCQLPPVCCDEFVKLDDIDLQEEGYTSIIISLLDPPDGLSVNGYMDREIVNLSIASLCDSVTKNDADVKFAVYAAGIGVDDYGVQVPLRDMVVKGTIHIVANPI